MYVRIAILALLASAFPHVMGDHSARSQDPAPAAGFRVVPHAELAQRRQRGGTDSRWTGIFYVGSDTSYHYFADTYSAFFGATQRLAVKASELSIDKVIPLTKSRDDWVNVSQYDLRAKIIPLAAGRKRIGFPLRQWRANAPVPAYRKHELGPVSEWEPIAGTPAVRRRVNLAKAARIVDDLSLHASTWPAIFRNEEERRLAVEEARNLSLALGGADLPHATELLVLGGRLASIRHNLEQPGAELSAGSYFQDVIARQPKHPEGNLHYGVFLAGSAVRCKEALPFLETAAEAGLHVAWQHIAAVHMILGDKDAAIAALERHLAFEPADTTSKDALEALKSGAVKLPVR